MVDEVGGEVEDMREELAKAFSLAGSGQDVNGNGKGREEDGGEDYAAEFEQQQQLHMMREQDTTLESVFHTVGNLRQQADSMGRELEEQAEMLEVTDGLTDRVGSRLSNGMKVMGTVIRRNEDRWSSCCIAVLVFVLIIILVLVLVL